MKFVTKNIWTILSFALVMVLAFAGDASAQGGVSVMANAQTKAVNIFKSVKVIIFILGGFGLIALAFFAIFGKLKWTWFASLAVGLAILAAAGAIVEYATGTTGGATGFGDTDSTSAGLAADSEYFK